MPVTWAVLSELPGLHDRVLAGGPVEDEEDLIPARRHALVR